jgi:hypothetical protein
LARSRAHLRNFAALAGTAAPDRLICRVRQPVKFIVKDKSGYALAYVCCEERTGAPGRISRQGRARRYCGEYRVSHLALSFAIQWQFGWQLSSGERDDNKGRSEACGRSRTSIAKADKTHDAGRAEHLLWANVQTTAIQIRKRTAGRHYKMGRGLAVQKLAPELDQTLMCSPEAILPLLAERLPWPLMVRPSMEDSGARKFEAIKVALAKKTGGRRPRATDRCWHGAADQGRNGGLIWSHVPGDEPRLTYSRARRLPSIAARRI